MPSVFLADLRHNYQGVMAVDVMPLGIGFMKAVMDQELPGVESRIFAYPDRLVDAIKDTPPDVLMLSNYCWNEAVSHRMARLMKQVRPETLVVMGGPNLHLEDERKVEYFRDHPDLDVYGLGEADFLAADIVRHFADAGLDLARFREREIPSSLQRRPDGSIALTPITDRRRDLDSIPSPWTSGVMDHFFDGKLSPMIETNRGCPFKCTFCAQGTDWYTKVTYFGIDRLRADVDYIGRMIKTRSPQVGTLVIADPNYGMYERDAEISGFLADAQIKYEWPKFISASTGKNRPDRIMRALERVNNALTFRQALQSTNPATLVQIKRANIKLDTYAEVMTEVQGRGMRSISDLILGLPEETLQSHVDAINQLVDAGTEEMYNFQLMLLKGTELEMLGTRDQYRFETRYRLISKAFGEYGGEKVFDIEEICIANSTMTFQDYIKARKYAFAFSVFWNNSWFADAVALAANCGIKRSEVLGAMLEALEADWGPAGKVLDSFVTETTHELFPTREACIAFYSDPANFERLKTGDVGDNLIYKYRAIAGFFAWPEMSAAAMSGIRKLVEAKGHSLGDTFWSDLTAFIRLRHAHGKSTDEILAAVHADLSFDIPAWLAAGAPVEVELFRFASKQPFVFSLPDDLQREMYDALRVWGNDVKGLTKGVTRIRAQAQLRTCQPAAAVQA